MPYSPLRHKKLLELLCEQRQMPLVDAIALFDDDKGNPDLEAAEHAIRFLEGSDTLLVRQGDADELSGFNSDCLEAPEHYWLVLNNLAGLETDACSSVEPLLVPAEWDAPEPNEQFVYPQAQYALRVIGDLDGAAALTERVRAFVHFFACNLLLRRFDKLESLLSLHIRAKNSAAVLEGKLLELEQEFGPLEFFDRLELQTIYSGNNAGQKLFTEMKLPKGVSRDDRRGEAVFQLVGLHTPGGVALQQCPVYLAVIEEAGMLKVCHLRWGEG